MSSPPVSVIIPVFNAERFLSDAINSVLSQGYPNLEFIFVDDGSTDRSKEIIDRTPGKVRYLQQENRGPAAARNRGLEIAEGDIFAFQDADDIWPARKLEIQLATLDKDPALEIVMGQVQRVQSSEATDAPAIENMDVPCFGVNLAASIFRRSAFERVGPFDEQLRFSEDVDWFMRARELGVKTAMINDVTLLYRIHDQNMTRDKALTNLNTFRVLKMSLDRRRREHGAAESLPALIDKPNIDQATSTVSVIIPVYNGELYLRSALESVFAQDHKPHEVIVVDDGSTDNTAGIISNFKDVRYVRQANQGVAVARNTALDIASGEFIAFLDQDDVWAPNKLSVQVRYFLDHPEIEYTLTHQQFFLEPGTTPPAWFRKELLSQPHPAFVPSALVARRAVFDKIGKFETQYSHASDSDWFFRANQAQLPMAVIPEVLLHRRIHAENESSKAKIALGELRRVVKRSIDLERAKTKSADSN